MVYINTLMIQDILAEPEWAGRLGDADRRGLTPLFTVNMTPYGEIQLNLDRRLNLAAEAAPAPDGLPGPVTASDQIRVIGPSVLVGPPGTSSEKTTIRVTTG